MSYAETRLHIARMLPKHAVGAEIGVWKGDFSATLLEHAAPRKLHLIDPWQTREDAEYDQAWYGKARGVNMDAVFAEVRKRFATEIASGQIELHRQPSSVAMAAFPDDALDFVYVDGDHSHDAVRSDLELAVRKVRKRGAICIDDHMTGKWWGDGVVRAVNEILGAYPHALQIALCADAQAVIVKRDDITN